MAQDHSPRTRRRNDSASQDDWAAVLDGDRPAKGLDLVDRLDLRRPEVDQEDLILIPVDRRLEAAIIVMRCAGVRSQENTDNCRCSPNPRMVR